MGVQVDIDTVNTYLERIKTCIINGRYNFESRKKNIESLAKVGLLPRHVKEYILQLTYRQYFNGPELEKNQTKTPGELMFFGMVIQGIEFYIKIKLFYMAEEECCLCLSFHEREKPIYYAFQHIKEI